MWNKYEIMATLMKGILLRNYNRIKHISTTRNMVGHVPDLTIAMEQGELPSFIPAPARDIERSSQLGILPPWQ